LVTVRSPVLVCAIPSKGNTKGTSKSTNNIKGDNLERFISQATAKEDWDFKLNGHYLSFGITSSPIMAMLSESCW
jgi:hypothetical protein